ncbi:Zn-dependent hydrolase (plasmid) [Arthrobacter sp. NicSoilB8]|nr:Zn-dependent hydrolase [Arthrobacter sp. NicSoilB8]
MTAAGLQVHLDQAGNLIGVRHGRTPAAPAIRTGSHTDTVIHGGRFDGAVGVVGGLEVARLLAENDIELDHDFIVVDFFGEETNAFGLSCLGSRALVGSLTTQHLDRVDDDGMTLGSRYEGFGLDPSYVLRAGEAFAKKRLHRYVELHVEQGPVLQERGTSIGVVTAIAGIQRLVADFIGRPDHAGSTPMEDRRDAIAAAASAVLAIRQEGCSAPRHGVSTTSKIVTEPGSPNVVSSEARLWAEIRSVDAPWLASAPGRLTDEIQAKAHSFGVEVDLTWWLDNPTVPAHEAVQETIVTAVDALGIEWQPIPSGAVHDAAHIAQLAPMGMIFVPSLDGRSHCPEEWTAPQDIVTGVHALAATILELDHS